MHKYRKSWRKSFLLCVGALLAGSLLGCRERKSDNEKLREVANKYLNGAAVREEAEKFFRTNTYSGYVPPTECPPFVNYISRALGEDISYVTVSTNSLQMEFHGSFDRTGVMIHPNDYKMTFAPARETEFDLWSNNIIFYHSP